MSELKRSRFWFIGVFGKLAARASWNDDGVLCCRSSTAGDAIGVFGGWKWCWMLERGESGSISSTYGPDWERSVVRWYSLRLWLFKCTGNDGVAGRPSKGILGFGWSAECPIRLAQKACSSQFDGLIIFTDRPVTRFDCFPIVVGGFWCFFRTTSDVVISLKFEAIGVEGTLGSSAKNVDVEGASCVLKSWSRLRKSLSEAAAFPHEAGYTDFRWPRVVENLSGFSSNDEMLSCEKSESADLESVSSIGEVSNLPLPPEATWLPKRLVGSSEGALWTSSSEKLIESGSMKLSKRSSTDSAHSRSLYARRIWPSSLGRKSAIVAVAMPFHVFVGEEGTRLQNCKKIGWKSCTLQRLCNVIHVKLECCAVCAGLQLNHKYILLETHSLIMILNLVAAAGNVCANAWCQCEMHRRTAVETLDNVAAW